MSIIDVTGITKRYGAMAALEDVSLRFGEGEFFGLLGPSGSGKTTLLRAIAGFVIPDAGEIRFDGERVEHVPVHKRGIGMVFQNYALFPHMSVAENIAFGLTVRGAQENNIEARVADMLKLVRLEGLGLRRPRELSGGQQQRVALARALITRPKVLLLDEPLGALDRRLRQEMQVELKDIQRKTGVTSIFVTHDQEEALTLSDRVAIIDRGKLVQVGPPRDVYDHPRTLFAAQFLGDANVLRGEGRIIRPEKLRILAKGTKIPEGLSHALEGHVLQAIYSGPSVTYRVACTGFDGGTALAFVQSASDAGFAQGEAVTLAWGPEHNVAVAS
jgi:ABC-type Fe3+/spermidine/putrescine transport system ATPase subunit